MADLRWVKYAIVGLVVVLVVVLYMAVIGTSVKLDDFNSPDDDSDDGDDGIVEPPPTAYATFSASGVYGGTDALPTATISTFRALVKDYYSPSTGAVYVTEKWDILGIPIPDIETVGYMEAIFVVNGMGLVEEWVSGKLPILSINGLIGGTWEIPETGRCFLQEKGTYTATLTLECTFADGGNQIILATKTITFEVNV